MAWANIGSLGVGSSISANQSSLVVTTDSALNAGNVGVINISVDNNQTTDGDEGAVSSVVDSAGNIWNKAIEFCNGQGSAQAGATCSVWYVTALATLPSGTGTITIDFTNSTSRDASAATAQVYSISPGNMAAVRATGTQAIDNSNPVTQNVNTINAEHLRIRCIATEARNTILTPTDTWTALTDSNANTGVDATSMSAVGEFKIVTGTGAASAPSLSSTNRDGSSVYVAFYETLAPIIEPVGSQSYTSFTPSKMVQF